MSEIKPKKERRFLKTLGRVGEILVEQVLLKLGSSIIKKIGGKKTLPSILFLFASLSLFAQFPNTLNKQRLGFQTTGDGLVWRGSISDTASIQPINNQNAWVILDTINLKFYTFDFTSNVWNLVGGAAFAQPVDSLFFNVNVPTNNVDTAKMRWDSDLATVVLGLNDNVPNELGFKNFWLVKNQTGSTITKGSLVYANGTVGASGRITVDKFIANGSIDAKYLLGITAHDLTDGEDGYVISFGKIRQVNTDTFAAGAILYPSPTEAGVWTDVEPIAPNIDMPIGFCINSSVNNGTIAIRVASGYKLNELHDVAISSPVEKASLYYSGGLWRDTTEALLVSDTASMLANYATKAYADTTGRLYARQDFTNVSSSTLTWTQSDTLIPGGVIVVQVYRNGQILLPSQYTIPTSTSVVIAASSFKVNDNYTVIFPRGGGAGSGGGSGSLTSISGGTGILVSPDPITTTGTVSADLSVLMELTDTSLLNLTSRFNTKQNTLVSGTNIKTVNSNNLLGSGNISVGTLVAADTVSLSNRINTKLNSTDTASLSNRINFKLNALDTASLSNRIDAKGTGTVTSVATGYGLTGGTITSTGTLLLDSAVVFSRIRDSIVDVAIGNDTIKILKQEYAPATTSVLTWTITPKFPIQLKQYILVFRNGQLLINDQYNLTDTNKITIVSNSFKVGANYTVVTVSGIGSVGTGVFPNPVYPEAGIAVSTGSAWASSIANNSSNWNVAFNDKITNAQFTGTTTKTLTLTQYDGGTFAPTFTDLQGVTGVTAGTGLTGGTITTTGTVAVDFGVVAPLASPTFTGTVSGITKSMVGLGNVDNTSDANKPISTATQTALNLKFNTADTSQLNLTSRFAGKLNYTDTSFLFTQSDTNQLNLTSRFAAKQNTLTNPVTGTGISSFLPRFTGTSTLDSTRLFYSSGRLGINMDATEAASHLTSRFVIRDFGHNFKFDGSAAGSGYTTTFSHDDTGLKIGHSSNVRDIRFTLNGTSGLTIANNSNSPARAVGIGNDSPSHQLDVTGTFRATGAATLGSTLAVTGDITENGNNVLTSADTTSMLLPYLRKVDTTNMLLPYFRDADTSLLNLTSRFAAKLNLSDTLNMLVPYLRKADTTLMLSKYLRRADTSLLNLTSRFAAKLNLSDTLNMLVPYLRKADTTLMLSKYLRRADTSLLNLTSRFAAKQNTLSGTGFVKASGTSITYDNSSYLRTGLADSTYLKLTGGTLTGGLTGTTALFSGNVAIGFPFAYKPFEVLSNANDFVSVGVNTLGPFQWSGIHFGYREADVVYRKSAIVFQRNEAGPADASGKIHLLNVNSFEGSRNADLRDAKLTIGNNGFVGINDTTPSFNLDITGTLNASGATTIGSTLAVSGDITEDGNNVLTSADTTSMLLPYLRKADTASLSSRIDSKFNSSGGTISGAVTLSTTTATPSSLLGKDGSNVVGNVRLTSPLSLAGDSLNLGTVPISKGGTGAESASVARTTLGVGYTFYSTTTGATISFSSNRVSLVITGTGSTTTIDLSTATSGRQYMIKNLSNASVVSGLSNVIPLTGGSPTTAILSAGNATPQWVTLVADGTNWHVMQSN